MYGYSSKKSVAKLRMMRLVGFSQLFASILFHLTPVQVSPSPVKNPGVILFREVWGRSLCRPMERLVDVVQEHPERVEQTFSPACVPLWRCSGCCGDESLQCHPTLARNVTMQLLKITPSEKTEEYVELTFLEHQTCECRLSFSPRKIHLKKQSKRKKSGRPRKRKKRKRTKDCGKCPRRPRRS